MPVWDHDGMMDRSGDGWLIALLVLVLVLQVAILVLLVVRAAGPRTGPPGEGPDPLAQTPREVLDQRLARGEITPEDYRAARSLLGR